MNDIDKQYLNILKDILKNGVKKEDRTGTGVMSVFGREIRYSFENNKFPILTTKKVAWKTMVTELLWFLKGDTNIKYLVDNNCNIWNGDVYKNYTKINISDINFNDRKNNFKVDRLEFNSGYPNYVHYSKDEFIEKIKNDDEFGKKWGELGPIYGKQWRNWGSDLDNNLYEKYLDYCK